MLTDDQRWNAYIALCSTYLGRCEGAGAPVKMQEYGLGQPPVPVSIVLQNEEVLDAGGCTGSAVMCHGVTPAQAPSGSAKAEQGCTW